MDSLEEETIPKLKRNSENDHSLKPEQKKIFLKEKTPLVKTKDATNYIYNVYSFLGLNLPQQHKIPYIIYSIIVNGLATIFYPLAFTISYTQLSSEDLEISHLLTSLQVVCDIYSCSAKITVVAFMMNQLRSVDVVLAKMDARCTEPDEIDEVRKCISFSRKFVTAMICLYLCYSTSTCVGSILRGLPPYSIYLPFINWRNSHNEFVVACIIEVMMIDFVCIQQTGGDSYGVIYVSILRAHMQILLMRIRKLGTNKTMSLEDNLEELKLCIKDHKNILELFYIIGPVISKTLFAQFIATGVSLGLTLLNIFVFATEFSTQIASFFYFLSIVLEVAPLCYTAQLLMDDSDRLSTEIFHSQWVDQDVRYRKMLIVFMQRSQKSMELTAGKVIPITLSSVMSIAKFSFSLYTLIKNMGIKEKFNVR